MKLVVLANIRGTTRTCKERMVKILKTKDKATNFPTQKGHPTI